MEDLVVVLFMLVMAGVVIVLIAYYTLKKRPPSDKSFAERYEDTTGRLVSKLGKEIVEVKLLGAGSEDHRSVGGAIVGGIVAGPVGAVIGGTQGGKGKQKQRFAIKYSDGSVVIKEVRTSSAEFKNLMKYVSWDDLK